MAVSTPCVTSIADKKRTGRFTNEEREERTPQGRGLQVVESVVMTISGHALSYRSGSELRRLHDAEMDRQLAALRARAAACGCECCAGHLPYLDAAERADALEDSVASHGDRLVAAMHALAKKLSGWIERAAVLMRGGR